MIVSRSLEKFGWVLLIGASLISGPETKASPPAISLQTISSGQLVSPVYLTNAGDGSNRLFVCDQVGQVRIIQDQMLLPAPFLDLSSKLVALTSSYDEAGLLSIAFHPGFSNPSSPGYQKFYVFYSAASPAKSTPASISAISTGTPCTITTSIAHGLTTGASVTITGVSGGTFSPAINATYTVNVIDANNFTVPVNCSSTSGLSLAGAQDLPTQPVYCRSTVSEFQVSAGNVNIADPTTERVVLAYDKPQDNHNGSHLEFGPDGYLYISVGDGGSQHDNDYGHTGGNNLGPSQITTGNLGNAQDTTKLLGKILRVDPLGTNGPGGTYGIPVDNPFASTGGGVRPEIFSYGMRNPWRYCFDNDPNLGQRMIEADVGQNDVEEINLIVSGGNYGWRIKEGTTFHDSTVLNNFTVGTLIDPVAQYFHPHSALGGTRIGSSVIGGYVYRGSAIPGLVGQYIFGDYSNSGVGTATGVLMALDSATWSMSQSSIIGTTPAYVTSFGIDESKELYVATKVATGPVNNPATGKPSGTIYKIVPAQVGQVNFATLTPSQDNTIFSESNNSDALGNIFAGRTSSSTNLRRGLLEFNVAAQIPAGSVITSAQLMLNMNMTSDTIPESMSVFKLTESWGQGTSSTNAGTGAAPTENDATWADRFYDPTAPTTWTTAGGTHSASVTVTNPSVGTATGYYLWSSTQMNTDIQGWLNTPSANNGWLLEGKETTNNSARRFDSVESAVGVRPTLLVTYTTSGQLTWRESWLQTYYPPIGTYVNDQADPTGDGLNNLLDYAYGYSPLVANQGYAFTVSNPSPAGVQTSLATNGGNDTYTMTFLRDPRAVDLTYQLQTSNDLVNWTTIVQSVGGGVPAGSGYVSEADQSGAAPVQVVTAVETLPAPVKHFARLIVTRTYQH